jgi:N-ethylmaleimide reductase
MPDRITTMDIFAPLDLGPIRLRNRIAMAPMTPNRAAAGGLATDLIARYYEQRASAGLIISEASQVSAQAVGYPGTPGIHAADQVTAWRQTVDRVHAAGGRIFVQLWHAGRVSHPSLQPEGKLPVAPSALAPGGKAFTAAGMEPFPVPRALDIAEIPMVVRQFADAARNARAAGFDGVEIHAASGYLIDQFFATVRTSAPTAMAGRSPIVRDSCWRWWKRPRRAGPPSASACACRPGLRSTTCGIPTRP